MKISLNIVLDMTTTFAVYFQRTPEQSSDYFVGFQRVRVEIYPLQEFFVSFLPDCDELSLYICIY